MSKLSKEVWKPVKYQGVDYSGVYEISNLGNLVKIVNGKREPRCTNTTRRRTTTLTKGDNKTKTISIARIMLASFYGVIFNRCLVADHINNNPLDDRLCNLQAITQGENISKDSYWKKKRK